MQTQTFVGLNSRELANLSLNDFVLYAENVLRPKLTEKPNRISVRFPYALNCKFEEKLADRDRRCKYTVFVNNAGTIAHVLLHQIQMILSSAFDSNHRSNTFLSNDNVTLSTTKSNIFLMSMSLLYD